MSITVSVQEAGSREYAVVHQAVWCACARRSIVWCWCVTACCRVYAHYDIVSGCCVLQLYV
jgi:hypothetical protein